MILLSVVLAIVGISIALLVLTLSTNNTMYFTILTFIITPMCLLSGSFLPTSFMPESVQHFSMILPPTWINSAFSKILLNESLASIGMDLFVATAISLVLVMIYLVVENNKKSKVGY